MTLRYILDTDHISLFQRGNLLIAERLAATPTADVAVSMITVAEQLQGRLAVVRRATAQRDVVRAYERLYETIQFYRTVPLVLYDVAAADHFSALRQQAIRIGTQDLQIAAIALALQAIVVTRNTADFSKVPGLTTEDWSQPASPREEDG